jgi:protein-tyrosine phosphatase
VPGVRIVLAHAERFDFLRPPGSAERWRDAGVILQVNGSSLVGGWGEPARQAGWDLLSRGVVNVLASDAHSVGQRRPRWIEAAREVTARLGESEMRRLCIENPRRILNGEEIA